MTTTHHRCFSLCRTLGAAVAITWMGLAAGPQPANALEISLLPKQSTDTHAIVLRGKIEPDDAFRLQSFIADLPRKAHIVVFLSSPGGSLQEGWRLGNLFHEARIATVIPAKASCLSACSLAFLGGRGTDGQPRRIKFSTGKLGFHMLRTDWDKDAKFTAAQMKANVERTVSLVYAVAEYFHSIGVDPDFLRIMMGAAPDGMNYLSNEDALVRGIHVLDEETERLIKPGA